MKYNYYNFDTMKHFLSGDGRTRIDILWADGDQPLGTPDTVKYRRTVMGTYVSEWTTSHEALWVELNECGYTLIKE